ncbi:MAG: 2-phospho-L-lactate transferase CofD family protein, partial [Desulfotomaculaceae bacterium]|nr:2-phospho-L-lactate transferase CofD family protein [Desulfotomaculaceae bacterium]
VTLRAFFASVFTKKVFTKPNRCLPLPEALAAIQEADAIVLGPGSLYTSIIPNLLIKGIPEALARTPAIKIYVCNVMTQPGETDGYTGSEHLQTIIDHAGKFLDYALFNTGQVPLRLRARYRQEGASPVQVDLVKIEKLGITAICAELIHKSAVVRHHPEELARAIVRLVLSNHELPDRIRYLHNYPKINPERAYPVRHYPG